MSKLDHKMQELRKSTNVYELALVNDSFNADDMVKIGRRTDEIQEEINSLRSLISQAKGKSSPNLGRAKNWRMKTSLSKGKNLFKPYPSLIGSPRKGPKTPKSKEFLDTDSDSSSDDKVCPKLLVTSATSPAPASACSAQPTSSSPETAPVSQSSQAPAPVCPAPQPTSSSHKTASVSQSCQPSASKADPQLSDSEISIHNDFQFEEDKVTSPSKLERNPLHLSDPDSPRTKSPSPGRPTRSPMSPSAKSRSPSVSPARDRSPTRAQSPSSHRSSSPDRKSPPPSSGSRSSTPLSPSPPPGGLDSPESQDSPSPPTQPSATTPSQGSSVAAALEAPTIPTTKLSQPDARICSYFQWGGCKPFSSSHKDIKGNTWFHACAWCYRVSRTLQMHKILDCPFINVSMTPTASVPPTLPPS